MFSCKDKKVQVPSYIHVTKFDFTTDLTSEGNPSQAITDGHVFVNGRFLGIFELPVTIPVPDEGPSTVIIIPGIKENGATANRQIIRTMESYEVNMTLEPTRVDTVRPTTVYKSNVFFAWMEDYELGLFTTEASNKNTTSDSIQIIDSSHVNAFPGSFSKYTAMIKVPANNERVFFEHYTVQKFIVPRFGTDVYLEIDYKTNIDLQIGIYADKVDAYEQIPFIILSPTTEWKKIYVNLKLETSALPANTPIQIFYGFVKPESNTTLSPEVYLDNFKLNYLN